MATPIRIGALGAARITPKALIQPARQIVGIEVCAVAARNPERARQFARQHAIPTVHETYAALINDPTLDAIYNPLPNSLHHPWTMRALRAGKHVLCEKPLAANAAEAQEMEEAANETGLVLMEAFHNLYHPLTQQIKAVVAIVGLGKIQHVEAHFNMPIPKFNDIRLDYGLAGGAAMDVGCYPIGLLRYLLGEEPTVVSAKAGRVTGQIDQQMQARLHFPSGTTGVMSCALFLPWRINISLKIAGSKGYVRAINPWLPQYFNWLIVQTETQRISRWVRAKPTYTYQLEAFVKAVNGEKANLSNGAFGVQNMQVIDSIYQAAGLEMRGGVSNLVAK